MNSQGANNKMIGQLVQVRVKQTAYRGHCPSKPLGSIKAITTSRRDSRAADMLIAPKSYKRGGKLNSLSERLTGVEAKRPPKGGSR